MCLASWPSDKVGSDHDRGAADDTALRSAVTDLVTGRRTAYSYDPEFDQLTATATTRAGVPVKTPNAPPSAPASSSTPPPHRRGRSGGRPGRSLGVTRYTDPTATTATTDVIRETTGQLAALRRTNGTRRPITDALRSVITRTDANPTWSPTPGPATATTPTSAGPTGGGCQGLAHPLRA